MKDFAGLILLIKEKCIFIRRTGNTVKYLLLSMSPYNVSSGKLKYVNIGFLSSLRSLLIKHEV